MILDFVFVLLLIFSVISGRKAGLFLTVARLGSLVLSFVLTALFGNKILLFLQGFSFYDMVAMKLTDVIENALKTGETALIAPFLEEANMAIELAAKSMADMIFTALIFALFSFVVRISIRLIDKCICRLPLVGTANRFLGMAVSLLFTVIISYLIIGFFGGIVMCSDAEFLREQMVSSVLVRFMYENNIVLNLFS